jgi:hypothetical protein
LATALQGVSYTGAANITSSTFIAVGAGGPVLERRCDNVDRVGFGVANNLNAVQFGGAKFVVVGDAGQVLVSVDSVKWTPITLTNNNLYALAFNGSMSLRSVPMALS